MNSTAIKLQALTLGLAMLGTPSGKAQTAWAAPQALALTGQFAGTHDPSIAMKHGKDYVFATGAAYPPVPKVRRRLPPLRLRSGPSPSASSPSGAPATCTPGRGAAKSSKRFPLGYGR